MSTSYPIILAHGICSFDRFIFPGLAHDNRPDDRFHYFRKIRSTFIRHGFETFHSRVSWAASLDKRATDLKNQISCLTDHFRKWPKVHIIAHSMGGLDARWMIYRHRMEKRVASLTTIGTPHLGTSYADWGLKRFHWVLDRTKFLGLNLEGLRDLTREACVQRNSFTERSEESNDVLYQTIAGIQPVCRIFPLLRPSYRIVLKEEGENDGLVSLRSAMWKEEYFLGTIAADHLNQVGWWDWTEVGTGMNREAFEQEIRNVYLDIARGLKDS